MSKYSHSGLATFRACPQKYYLRYECKLERDTEEEGEALSVGKAWHGAFEADRPMHAISEAAPSTLWAHKLARLYTAHGWYWGEDDERLEVVDVEKPFVLRIDDVIGETVLEERSLVGFIDAVVRDKDGRLGIIERKTTASDIGPASPYWDQLLMSPQHAVYAAAVRDIYGALPSFVIYDVVKKPGIKPKAITAAQKKAWATSSDELAYCDEPLHEGEELLAAESERMYAARLSQAIYANPAAYFARREAPITEDDVSHVLDNIITTIDAIEFGCGAYKNPDSCMNFNRPCEFLSLCKSRAVVTLDDPCPDGFRRRTRVAGLDAVIEAADAK